jgi:hypothetical protein
MWALHERSRHIALPMFARRSMSISSISIAMLTARRLRDGHSGVLELVDHEVE